MIFDVILGFICAIPNMLLNSLSSLGNFVIPEGTFNWWYNIFDVLTYVFPVWAVLPILFITFAITGFSFIWSIILRVKSFIPTMRCLIQNWWQRTEGVAPICIV